MYNENENFSNLDKPMTLGDWVVTLILTAIPIANIVLLFVWGFSSNTNTSKKNWARATLIFFAVGIAVWVLFLGSMVGSIISNSQNL